MTATNVAATTAGSWGWRAILPAIGLGLLGTASALYAWARPVYMSILSAFMLRPYHIPFFDFEYLLTTATCWQHGVNVYLWNPCDELNRLMGYSPLWLRMRFLAIDHSWSAPLGLALAVLFCLSLAALVPTRRWRDQLAIGLVAFSPLTIYGVERGNIDLLVYLVALIAGFALAGDFVVRVVGYGLLLGAGILKFYPIVALVVVVRERLATFIAVAIVSAAITLGFAAFYYQELLAALRNLPFDGYFWDSIGAKQLPGGIGYVLQPILARLGGTGWIPANSRILIAVVACLVIAMLLSIVIRIAISAEYRRQIAALPPRYAALLQIGAALIIGCFFAGESVSYRAIMFLLAMPGLVLLDQPLVPRRLRLLVRCTTILIIVVMFRLAVIGVLTRFNLGPKSSALAGLTWIGFELAWWWIISVLAALLTCSILESTAWRELWTLLCEAGLMNRMKLPTRRSAEDTVPVLFRRNESEEEGQ